MDETREELRGVLTDVRYAVRQHEWALRQTCEGRFPLDPLQRLGDALERIQERLQALAPSVAPF